MLDLNKLILEATKAQDRVRMNALKNLKAKVMEFKTAKNAKPYDEAAEVNLISKMAKELAADLEIFQTNGRDDLAASTKAELEVIESFLPKMATKEDIEAVVRQAPEFQDGKIEQKQMGLVIKFVKSQLANADGKMVSDVVRSFIG